MRFGKGLKYHLYRKMEKEHLEHTAGFSYLFFSRLKVQVVRLQAIHSFGNHSIWHTCEYLNTSQDTFLVLQQRIIEMPSSMGNFGLEASGRHCVTRSLSMNATGLKNKKEQASGQSCESHDAHCISKSRLGL